MPLGIRFFWTDHLFFDFAADLSAKQTAHISVLQFIQHSRIGISYQNSNIVRGCRYRLVFEQSLWRIGFGTSNRL